jgi:hypothetical protein
MTVESIGDDGINCIWFDGKRRNHKPFPPETLRKRRRTSSKPPNITLRFVGGDGRVVSTQKLSRNSN